MGFNPNYSRSSRAELEIIMKILLTGGSGFIGRNILESCLTKKYEIHSPVKSVLDITIESEVKEFLKNNYFDLIIHAACKPGHRNALNTSTCLNENLRMFYNIIKYKSTKTRFINIGSGAIYDSRNYKPKMEENYAGLNIPVDDHGLCKYTIFQQSKNWNNFVDLRIFGIFGKYEDYSIRFISNAICKAIFNLPITIKQNRKFDYLFINDLMPILDFFIENSWQYNSYNVTPPKSVELYEIAQIVREIANKPNLPIKITNDNELGLEYSGSNMRLINEIEMSKFTPLIESIAQLYQWYYSNKLYINQDNLLIDK